MTSPDTAERSIEDDVRAAMAEHVDEPVAPQAEEVTADDVSDAIDGGRDEKGRFKAKDVIEEAPATEVADAPAPEAQEAETDDKPVQPDPYGLAPATWTKEAKEKWGNLEPDIRAEITRRERETHQLATRYDGERQYGKQVKEIITPYEGFIKSLGAEPLQAVDYLIKTEYLLRTSPLDQRKAILVKAARDYGVDLTDGYGFEQQAPQIDPNIETLQQRIARLESEQNAAIERARETEQQDLSRQIESFASDPRHAYFDRVQPLMATFLQSGQAEDLEKAYEMAVYADPETRALQLAAQQAEQERKRSADLATKVNKARSASVSVVGAPGSAAMPSQTSDSSASLEDDIRSAIRAASGRV